MEDDIRIHKTENGGTVMVNVTAINEFMDTMIKESVIERLKRCGEQPKESKPKAAPSRKHEFAI